MPISFPNECCTTTAACRCIDKRAPEQVIHDSLQEWNSDEFEQLDWNTKAAQRVIRDLKEAGYIIVPG